MEQHRPRRFSDAAAVADTIVEQLDGQVVLALPLGLGKANLVANALYERAARDTAVSLTILTALTLESPHGTSRLHRRFIDPIRERIFDGYPDLAYAAALRRGTLPRNIEVVEFFLLAGRWLGVPEVQQNHISENYTNVARTLLDRGLNVVAQMFAREGNRMSMSCNADLTPDLLRARAAGDADFLVIGEVNDNLPFMEGDAVIPESAFDCILEGPQCSYTLFAPPKPPVALADYAAGLWIARLITDGGTFQIGIGSIGDAVAKALILRQQKNPVFRDAVARLSAGAPEVAGLTQDTVFEEGLFGLSEMLVDSFLPLIDAGVIKRKVGDAIVHAAFFLGPDAFYDRLRKIPQHERRKIQMKPVSWVNSLYRDEEEKRAARVKARFVNNAMMATLLGAVVSGGLENGKVVSGVGGQYDFVAQSFALDGARSIVALNATRLSRGKVRSNIFWSYGHQTIPRHLRDIVVTEYGVANLRGRTDAEVIASMLAITDSRFQPDLLAQAKQAGKIESGYEIPEPFTDNTPEKIAIALQDVQHEGFLPRFPFGSDFTDVEQQLLAALEYIRDRSSSRSHMLALMFRGMTAKAHKYASCLERMNLLRPRAFSDRAVRFLLIGALIETSPQMPENTRFKGEN